MRIEARVEDRSRKLTPAFVSPVATNSCRRVACRNELLVAGMIVFAGTAGLPSALGQAEGCPGLTACPSDCPVWCQPADPGECDPACESCEDQVVCPSIDCADFVEPCCGPDEGCETFTAGGACCDDPNDPTGLLPNCEDELIPMTDLVGDYQGHVTGLYIDNSTPPVQTNDIPPGHRAAAMRNGSRIVPRSPTGNVDWTNGYLGLLLFDRCNPMWEYDSLINNHVVITTTELNSNPVFVNGPQGGEVRCGWREAPEQTNPFNPWEVILGEEQVDDPLLNHGRTPGGGSTDTVITAQQAQVVRMKMAHGAPLNLCNEVPGPCAGCEDIPPTDHCTWDLCGSTDCGFPNWVYSAENGEVAVFREVLERVRASAEKCQEDCFDTPAWVICSLPPWAQERNEQTMRNISLGLEESMNDLQIRRTAKEDQS